MDIFWTKILLMLAIFFDGYIGGMLPYWRKPEAEQPKFLELGNAFAAGIFLSLGLLFMLHNANHSFREELFPEVRYPIAFALALVAFLALMLVEHVLPSWWERQIVHAETGEGTEDFVTARSPQFAPYMLLAALAFGSFIAGLALGSQPDMHNVLLIFIAIVAHKGSAGFALGVRMRRGGLSRSLATRLILLFSLTTPVGILAGLLATHLMSGNAEKIFAATSIALLAGVFLYIATLDILHEQLAEKTDHIKKWLLLVSAVVLMLILEIWL